ncbi:Aste57867_21259 [Aphanomyces stellatus]|uniref:Cytochrome c peroxidase, mitochondrial n=1 Tax=Aphanomyces stellatus TaxID=120398 RepID=A0A485LH12_9STRA|nr:hypothetical protein As57867_021190 [Aphanomyces stellatus]VFT97931.1 Aste57867_21259 [Aphanomyces stellatus]
MFRQVASRASRVGATLRQAAPRTLVRSMSVASTIPRAKSSNAAAIAAAFLFASGASATLLHAKGPSVDLNKVRADIVAAIETDNSLGGTFVRLAWHSSGTYGKSDGIGGSKAGTIGYVPELGHGANRGLVIAVEKLNAIQAKYPGLSKADLYIYAGIVAISEMGGPEVNFRLGRKDASGPKDCPPEGRLPDADKGTKPKTIQHVRDIFYRMGFNDREIVALIGAHAVGRCYPTRSGYSGPWTRAETTFSNEYFRELVENKWTLKKWNGPEQYEDPTGDLMMLPADMAFIWDPEFKKYVVMYAKDEELWHKDFAKAFQKMTENGVKF